MNDLISLIVPIYNREKTIIRCIESILNQTYSKLEILLINDGSTDNSLSICKHYEKKDSRIRVINKINEGVSSARNIGIREARGQYIQFVDSDDTLIENMCEILITTIKKDEADIVVCGFNSFYRDDKTSKSCLEKTIGSMTEIKEKFDFLYLNGFLNPPWNKLYRKEIINLKFDESLNLGEDLIFNLKVIKSAKKITFIKNCLYNYYMGSENSLVFSSFNRDNFQIALQQYLAINEFCNYFEIDNQYRSSAYQTYLTGIIGALQIEVYRTDKTSEEKKIYISKMINNENTEFSALNIKYKILEFELFRKLIINKNTDMIYFLFKIKKLIFSIINNFR